MIYNAFSLQTYAILNSPQPW